MPYLGNIPATQFAELKYQDFTGGTGTSFTLNDPVGSAQELEVFVNNVRQEPGVAYTVSGTTLTMTGSIVASDDFYVVFQGKSVGTATHPATQNLTAVDGTFTGNVDIDGTTTIDGLTSSEALDVTTSTHANASVFKSTGNTQIMLQDTDASANDQFWGLQVSGGDFNILTCNDDRASGFSTPFYIKQAGTIVSSSGIAIGGTGTANTLDDYEEGSFSPIMKGTSSNPTVTYTNQTGRYTKIGNKVTGTINIQWSAFSGGSGTLAISLPFATDAGASYQGVFTLGYNNGISVQVNGTGYNDPGRQDYYLRNGTSNTGTVSIREVGASGHLIHGFQYQVS